MGQKTHPIGFRLGVIKKWDSNWYAEGTYVESLHSDLRLRRYIKKELYHAGISSVQIERKGKQVKINIFAARPGIIIGKKGQEVDKLKAQIQKMLAGKELFLNIKEERKPEISAQLVAESIATQLERRVAFRRAMKKSVSTAMRFGAKGIRINCSGRLAGAEIARMEWYREGRVPLHTLRADIDYGTAEAHTTYGIIGIKVWIFRGEIYFGKDARRLEEQRKIRSQKQIEEAVEAARAEMGITGATAVRGKDAADNATAEEVEE
jgi:small subunit ribosomal protein S3